MRCDSGSVLWPLPSPPQNLRTGPTAGPKLRNRISASMWLCSLRGSPLSPWVFTYAPKKTGFCAAKWVLPFLFFLKSSKVKSCCESGGVWGWRLNASANTLRTRHGTYYISSEISWNLLKCFLSRIILIASCIIWTVSWSNINTHGCLHEMTWGG